MTMPPDAIDTVKLATFKAYIGARTDVDDELLSERLAAAVAYVYEQVYESDRLNLEVQEAILILASRLYKRRQTPEGVAGFGGEGAVVHIVARDPDVATLLDRHVDYSKIGFG